MSEAKTVSQELPQCTAFENFHLIAQGTLHEISAALKKLRAQRELGSVLIFDTATGEEISSEVDAPFATEAALAEPPRGPGRPKMGVIAREITLLPRHWQWLESQPGGASVALRKLVELARKEKAPEDRIRHSI